MTSNTRKKIQNGQDDASSVKSIWAVICLYPGETIRHRIRPYAARVSGRRNVDRTISKVGSNAAE